jgi:hypothetical protein
MERSVHRHSRVCDVRCESGHGYGPVDPSILTSECGIWAVKWSLVVLAITAAIQVAVVLLSGSVALLADTSHNLGDALTAVIEPLAQERAKTHLQRRIANWLVTLPRLATLPTVPVVSVQLNSNDLPGLPNQRTDTAYQRFKSPTSTSAPSCRSPACRS